MFYLILKVCTNASTLIISLIDRERVWNYKVESLKILIKSIERIGFLQCGLDSGVLQVYDQANTATQILYTLTYTFSIYNKLYHQFLVIYSVLWFSIPILLYLTAMFSPTKIKS